MPANETHSPDLIALLNDAHERGEITRKQFGLGADIPARTVDHIFVNGWEAWDKVKRAIRGVPLTLAYDMLVLLVGGRFTVAHRGAAAEDCGGVEGALRIAETAAETGLEITRADADGRRTDFEHASIAAQINRMRRMLDCLEEDNDRRRESSSRAAG